MLQNIKGEFLKLRNAHFKLFKYSGSSVFSGVWFQDRPPTHTHPKIRGCPSPREEMARSSAQSQPRAGDRGARPAVFQKRRTQTPGPRDPGLPHPVAAVQGVCLLTRAAQS